MLLHCGCLWKKILKLELKILEKCNFKIEDPKMKRKSEINLKIFSILFLNFGFICFDFLNFYFLSFPYLLCIF